MKDSEKKKGPDEAGSSSPRDNLVPAPKRKRTAYQYVPTEGTLPAPTSPMLFRDDRVSDLAAKTALRFPPPINIPSSSGLEEKNTTQESAFKKLAGDGSHMKQQARNSKEAGTDLAASRRIGNFNVDGKLFQPFSSDPAEPASSNQYVPTPGALPAPTYPMLFRGDRVSNCAAKTALRVPPPNNNPSSSVLKEKNTTQESHIKKLAGDGSHMKQQARNSKEAGMDLAAARRIGNYNVAGKFFQPLSSDPAEASSKPTWKIVLLEKAGLNGGGMVQIGIWNGLQINMEELHNSRTGNEGLLLPDNLAAELYGYATPPEREMMGTDAGLQVVAFDEYGREYSMLCQKMTYTTSGGNVMQGLVLKADWAEIARAHGGSTVAFIPNAKSTDGSLLINAFRYKDGRLCLVFLFQKPQGGGDDQ